MNIGFYNPYNQHLGGGEYYLYLMMQQFLPKHTVFYYSDDVEIIKKAEKQFSIDLEGIRVVPPLPSSFIKRQQVLLNLDKLFWYSDGSIPLSSSKEIYVIFQFPVPWVTINSLAKVKLSRVNKIIVNSLFTKKFIDKTFNCNSNVLYPAINLDYYTSEHKTDTIISVGRFTQAMNTKRQDVLIDVFKTLVDKHGYAHWRLKLFGGATEQDMSFVSRLKEKANGYPIDIVTNAKRSEILSAYSKAKIYLHAAGYEINQDKHPEQVEHFGISVVEAIASNCIPLVYDAGGPKEILSAFPSCIWKTRDDLIKSITSLEKVIDIQTKIDLQNLKYTFGLDHFRKQFSSYTNI